MPPEIEQYYGSAHDMAWNFYNSQQGNKPVWQSDLNKTAYDLASLQYQNAYNEYQAEQAWQREQKAIRLQNEYNSPSNQLARYIEAGLNPALIYGQVSPGLQSSIPSYNAPRSATPQNSVPGSAEKISRAMNILGMVGSIASTIAGVAGNFSKVENMSLQNEILKAQLPEIQANSSWAQLLARVRAQMYHDSGEFNLKTIEDYGDIAKLIFPDYFRTDLAYSKSEYQNWWNEKIAPIYQSVQEGKKTSIEAEASIKAYNDQMLNSLPPAVRPIFSILMPLLQSVLQFIPKPK